MFSFFKKDKKMNIENKGEKKSDLTNLETTTKRPELAKHDATILDLAFVMDCTGSMGSYIQNATDSIRQIVEDIVALEKSDIKLALVEYRDHPPQDETFVTRVHDFTESIKEMKKWLEACRAEGGGDLPEAVADGLHDALKLNWRENATKICVLISDAPPHGLSSSDSFPNGCPAGIDPLDVVRRMAQKGITLYSVGCEPAIRPYKDFFTAIAYTTGGQYIPLRNANLLSKVIVGGAVEEISLDKLLEEAQKEVEHQTMMGVTDERLLTEAVEKSLKTKGVKTNQIRLNNSNLERASEDAIKYSKISSMTELKKEYKLENENLPVPYSMSSMPMRMFSKMSASTKSSKEVADSGDMLDFAAAAAPAVEENYSIAQDDISTEQSERLVQKILNRKK